MSVIPDDIANLYSTPSVSPDEDAAVRTVIGEARNEGPRGWQAVGGVIRNRAKQSGLSLTDVVHAPSQFEPWSHPDIRQKLNSISPNDPIYRQVASTVLPVLRGTAADPTGGATHFYAPKAQAALGRSAPSFDNGTGVDIGNHRFFKLGYSGKGVPRNNSFDPFKAYASDESPTSTPTTNIDDILGAYAAPEKPVAPVPSTSNPTNPTGAFLPQTSTSNATPESPDTIQTQIDAVKVPGSTRYGVLPTSQEQAGLLANDPTLTPFTYQGKPIWIDATKAKKLGLKDNGHIQTYLDKNPNALMTILGTPSASNVGDNTTGTAVTTSTPNGTEGTSTIVTHPSQVPAIAAQQQTQIPGGQTKVVPAQAVVQQRAIQPSNDNQGDVRVFDDNKVDANGNVISQPAKQHTEGIGTVQIDPKWSDEDKVRYALNQTLIGRDTPNGKITPEDIDNWIAAAKATGDPSALVAGDRSSNQFTVHPNVLQQIWDLKKKTPDQLAEELKQRTIAPPTDADYKQQAITSLVDEKHLDLLTRLVAADPNYKNLSEQDIAAKLPSLLTDDEIAQKAAELKSQEPSQAEKESRFNQAQEYEGNLGAFQGGLSNFAGDVLHQMGGVLRPFSSKGYQWLQQQGNAAKLVAPYRNQGEGAKNSGESIAQGAGEMAPQLLEMMALPGGAEGKFAFLGASQAAGEGKSIPKTAEAGLAGYGTGKVFGLAEGMENPLARLGTVFGGSAAINATQGMPIAQNVQSSLVNTAFEVTNIYGTKAAGKFYRFWQGGEPYDLHITEKGGVDLLPTDPNRQITGGEVITDPKNPVYDKLAASNAKAKEAGIPVPDKQVEAEKTATPPGTFENKVEPQSPFQSLSRADKEAEIKKSGADVGEQSDVPASEGTNPRVEKATQSVATKVPDVVDTFLYHGTGEGAFRRIREEGLVPEKTADGKYVYFSDAEQYSDTYAERKGNPFGNRVLRVKQSDAFEPDTRTGEGDFRINKAIPPEDIEVRVQGKWMPIQDYANEDIGIPTIERKAPTPPSPPVEAPKGAGKDETDWTELVGRYSHSKPPDANDIRILNTLRDSLPQHDFNVVKPRNSDLGMYVSKVKYVGDGVYDFGGNRLESPEQAAVFMRMNAMAPTSESEGYKKPSHYRQENTPTEKDYDAIYNPARPTTDATPDSPVSQPDAPGLDVPAAYGDKNVKFTRDKAEAAKALLLKKFGGEQTKFGSGGLQELDGDTIKAIKDLAGYHLEAGIHRLGDLKDAVAKEVGDWVRPHLDALYPGMKEAETAKPSSIMNAEVDTARENRGWKKLSPELRKANPDLHAAVKDIIANDPDAPLKTFEKFEAHPKSVPTDEENVLLNAHYLDVKREHDEMTKRYVKAIDKDDPLAMTDAKMDKTIADKKLDDAEQVLRRAGTASGRSLQSRQMFADEDFEYAKLERDFKIAKGREPSSEEVKQLQQIADEHKAKSEALEAVLAGKDQELADIKASIPPRHILDVAENYVNKLHNLADRERERLKSKGNVFQSGIDPRDLKSIAIIGADHLANMSLDFAKFSDKMIDEFGDKIKPHLDKIYDEAQKILKGGHVDLKSDADKMSMALKAQKTRMVNCIQELENAIKNRERIVRVKNSIEPDAQLEELRGKAKSLQEDYDAIFPKEPRTIGDEQRLKMLKGQAENRIAQLDKAIQTNERIQKVKPSTVTDEKLAKLHEQRDELQKQYDEQFPKPARPPMTDAQRLQALEKRLQKKQGAIEEKIANGDLSENPKRMPLNPQDVRTDTSGKYTAEDKVRATKIMQAQAQIGKIEKRYDRMKRDAEKANEPLSSWAQRKLKNYVRGSMLSAVTVIEKLGAASLGRIVTRPMKQTIGAVASVLPGLRRIAGKAAIEGSKGFRNDLFNESHALAKAVTTGVMDIGRTISARGSDISNAYGRKENYLTRGRSWAFLKGKSIPFEASQLIGLMHDSLKAPAFRSEYEGVLGNLIMDAKKNGQPIDGETLFVLGQRAYDYAQRAKFGEKRKITDLINQHVLRPLDNNEITPVQAIGTFLHIVMPIHKISTNVIAQSFESSPLGLAKGITKAATAHIKGLDNLTPDQADIIMRNIKNGSLGTAMYALGLFGGGKVIGSFYQKYDKDKDKDVAKYNTVEIDGVRVPGSLLHLPEFNSMFMGATTKRIYQELKAKNTPTSEAAFRGAGAGVKGLAEETPGLEAADSLTNIYHAIFGGDKEQMNDARYGVGNFIAGRAVPGIVRNAAEAGDQDPQGHYITPFTKEPYNRKGDYKTFGSSIKTQIQKNIPGWRNKLPNNTP